METNDGTSAAFQYNRAMDSVAPPSSNGLPAGENDASASRMIHQAYKAVSPGQQAANERPEVYSNRNNQSQNLYGLPDDQQQLAMGNDSAPNTMETTDIYQHQQDGDEREYAVNDPNMDTYMAEQDYNQYSGYNTSQYQEEQYANNEQFDVTAQPMEDSQTVPDTTGPNTETLH